MTNLFQNPRSGWKHKVSHPSRAARLGTPPWGGAKRNSRLTKRNQTERAQRATVPTLRFTVVKGYRPLGGLSLHTPTIPGVRLRSTPGLTLLPRFAGSRQNFVNLGRAKFRSTLRVGTTSGEVPSVCEAKRNHRLKSVPLNYSSAPILIF